MSEVKAEIVKDSNGFPILAKVSQGINKLEMNFDKDSGFTLKGSRRSYTPELLQALRMIYPFTEKTTLTIPEPLQVINVAGSPVILYDDMESALVKWTEGALDNTVAYQGAKSLKVTVLAGGTVLNPVRFTNIRANGNMKISCHFAVDAWAKTEGVSLGFYSYGFNGRYGYIRIEDNVAYYRGTAANVNLNLPGLSATNVLADDIWHEAEVSLNVKTGFYDYARLNHWKVDLKNVPLPVLATGNFYTYIWLEVDNVAGQESIVWFDDVMVTGD